MQERKHRIGFVGSRFAGIDGVSLETRKWADVLVRNGHACFFFAGEVDCRPEQEYIAPEAHFHYPDVRTLNRTLLHGTHRTPESIEAMHDLRRMLKRRLADFVALYQVDTLIIENALALPVHLPLALAVTEFLFESDIPAIAHHHDFVWERVRFAHTQAPEYIDMACPPRTLPKLAHVTINTLATKTLYAKKGIRAITAPNVMDFARPPAPLSTDRAREIREGFALPKHARIFLQPTRIVPRKEIEDSIQVLSHLPDVVLLVSHASGDEDDGAYLHHLAQYAELLGVDVRFVADRVEECVGKEKALATLPELYALADMVMYLSAWEGFGNALIETMYYRKPLCVRRYPVYVRDIAPKGCRAIEYEPGMDTQKVAQKIERLLADKKRVAQTTEHNYAVGEKHFSYEKLEDMLVRLLAIVHTHTT
jgi:glycosyltransferase involved in cell wall biosynthesis